MVLHGLSRYFRLAVEDSLSDRKMLFIYKFTIDRIIIDGFNLKSQIMVKNQACLASKPSIVGSIRNKTMKPMVNPVKKTTVKRGEILL